MQDLNLNFQADLLALKKIATKLKKTYFSAQINIKNYVIFSTCPPKVAGLKGSNPRCRKTPGGGGLLIVFLLNIRLQFCTIVIIASEHSWDTLLLKKRKI